MESAMKMIQKLIVAAAMASSVVFAVPASAATYIIFLDEYYNPIGYQLYCSNGYMISSGGVQEGYMTYMDVNDSTVGC
jgi:hypothetical protein